MKNDKRYRGRVWFDTNGDGAPAVLGKNFRHACEAADWAEEIFLEQHGSRAKLWEVVDLASVNSSEPIRQGGQTDYVWKWALLDMDAIPIKADK